MIKRLTYPVPVHAVDEVLVRKRLESEARGHLNAMDAPLLMCVISFQPY